MLNKRYILFLIIVWAMLFGYCGENLYAQLIVNRVQIAPLNRAIIFCSEIPSGFTSELSDDKRKIIIKIENASVEEAARQSHGSGIIEDIYIQQQGSVVEISVILNDKRGYSAVPLPYSKALMIEVFRWDNITPAEDNYRQGLLAIEDGNYSTAEIHFLKAAKLGSKDASAQLGIIQLKQGKINSAVENLKKAIKSETSIPDAYAAYSHILVMKKLPEKANQYANIFFKKTGLKSFPEIEITKAENYQTETSEPVSLLESMAEPREDGLFILDDEAQNNQQGDSSTKSDRFEKLFKEGENASKDSSAASSEQQFPSLLPDWTSAGIFFVILFIFALFIFLLFAYLRWRKKQINKVKKTLPANFDKDLKSAQRSISARSRYAADAYKKAEKTAAKPNEPKPSAKKREPVKKPPDKPAAKTEIDSKEKLFEVLAKVSEENISESREENSLKDGENEIRTIQPMSAKLELALHLHKEQQKLKKQDIETLKQTELPTDKSKLIDVAKKLGIEKGSIEIQNALKKIEADKGAISKLAEKFSVKKDKEKK